MATKETMTEDMAVGCDGQPIEATLRQWIEALSSPTIAAHSVGDIALFNGGCITDDLKIASDEIEKLRELLNGRDGFIVQRGLFDEFVKSL